MKTKSLIKESLLEQVKKTKLPNGEYAVHKVPKTPEGQAYAWNFLMTSLARSLKSKANKHVEELTTSHVSGKVRLGEETLRTVIEQYQTPLNKPFGEMTRREVEVHIKHAQGVLDGLVTYRDRLLRAKQAFDRVDCDYDTTLNEAIKFDVEILARIISGEV